jgi:Tol biopolymer transport system component
MYSLPDPEKSEQVIMSISIDSEGQKLTEPSLLPLKLDFSPILDHPSPDGRYLLLRQPVEPAGRPYVFDWQNQQAWPVFRNHPLQEHIIGQSYGWHPDSRRFLFWSFGSDELWLVDVETGEYTILALTWGPIQGAAISPDGQWAAYVGQSEITDQTMWLVSTSGGEAKPLAEPGTAFYVFGWSPDNQYILYAGGPIITQEDVESGSSISGGPLWLMDIQGENRRPLMAPFIYGWGLKPAWSPDNQWVA